MITIINEKNGHKVTFKSYEKLYNHINNHQHTGTYERLQRPCKEWMFTRHSYRRVRSLYEFVQSQRMKDEGKPEGEIVDLLEIYYGPHKAPLMVPISPDMNIESYLEDWCRRYCQSKGYKLVEVYDNDGVLRVKREHNNQCETQKAGDTIEGDPVNFSAQ